MILSIIIILAGLFWLMVETDWLRVNLMGNNPEPIQIERKHNPSIEPCRIVNAPYREYWHYKAGTFTALDLPESTLGNVNIISRRE